MPVNLLTADQVAQRLGVRRATIYAYVSRGLLARQVAPDGRTSLFDPDEVDALARRGRPRREGGRSGTVDVVLTTSITAIDGDRLYLRGVEVGELVGARPFEAVAELLWSGTLGTGESWPVPSASARAVTRAVSTLPDEAPAGVRLAMALTALAGADPGRGDLRPEVVRAKAGGVLAALPSCLAPVGEVTTDARRPRPLAEQLWPRLSALRPTSARVRALDATLVALADHELATSTLAARVAASTRANPYACLLAAVGAGSGPLHGRAAVAVQRLLLDAIGGADPVAVIGRALDEHGVVPGFGHPLYTATDPRAALLLDTVAAVAPRTTAGVVQGVQEAATAATGLRPNVDFALGALGAAGRMPLGATEAIFLVARVAGWIAHVVEEYGERPLRFRARSIYTGPPVG
jgi:citrate synthase